MNADVKEAFTNIKPICDVLMVCPTLETLEAYTIRVVEMNKRAMQELQQDLLIPLITRVKGNEMGAKEEVNLKMLAAVKLVLERITINSFGMFLKLESGLLSILYDHRKHEMTETNEEVKLATLECLIATMLHIPHEFKDKVLKTQVPMIAQTVFVSVHIAKLEKMRALKMAALENVMAHTLTHPKMTTDYHIKDAALELSAVDNMLSGILPGVVGALQDVAMARDNQGHLITTTAVEAIHRVLCLAMNDKYLPKESTLRAEDFIKMVKERKKSMPEVSKKEFFLKKLKEDSIILNIVSAKKIKDLKKRSQEWFDMADEKLFLVTQRLCILRLHEHVKVRKELAVYCHRLVTECSRSMLSSHGFCLDVLICFTKDDHPEVSEYARTTLRTFLDSAAASKLRIISTLGDNFLAILTTFPRAMNAVDNATKQSALNLLHGHIAVLSDGSRPQGLTTLLSVAGNMVLLCTALCHAARHATKLAILTRHANRDVSTPPPVNSPWSTFLHLDTKEAVQRLQEICQLLGASECSELILDSLLDQFRTKAEAETVFICNWMASDPKAPVSLSRRLLNTYLEEDVWYLPIEVDSGDAPVGKDETLDPTVYNPRAWTKDSVPDLYEGAVETRYTDISYAHPRLPTSRAPHTVGTVGEAQTHLVLSCLLTEGVALAAQRLGEGYQLYLLRTLCLILERVGSEYELLQLAGLKAIHAIAKACGHQSPTELIKANADYFTNQITVSLKKSWNCQSALQILTVVMEYSDAGILDCMYGIVEHVLVQSCDKYYEHNLSAYLQVFLTFVECIRKWFPSEEAVPDDKKPEEIDLLAELNEYVRETQEAERLLSDSDIDSGRSLDMYQEDLQRREEEVLDYDDRVTEEKPPLPQHVRVALTILSRSVHFITSGHRDNAILAMQVLDKGLPVLARYEDELLPLVHVTWAPLVSRFHSSDPVLLRRAFDLLVTLAALAKDFIRARTVKEVLPEIYKFLHKSAKDSHLKDTGSYYRSSQAYYLQMAALDALPRLASDLGLEDEGLQEAMACVDAYLSKKQPKPLQQSAVSFFKKMLDYSYGTAWFHIRDLCNNDAVIEPPELHFMKLEPLVGTPFQARDQDYDANVKRIFDYMVS